MGRNKLTGFAALIVLLSLDSGSGQTATLNVRVESLLRMQQGIGWPLHLYVAEGNEALMRLSTSLADQQSCKVTTPAGLTFDVNHPPNNRYKNWSDGCGVRIQQVVAADEGRWRLTSTRGNDSLTGWSELHIEEKVSSYTPGPISLQDGQMNAEVDLSSLNNTYCLVAQPFSESKLVPGHCHVTLDRTTRAVQGRWSVLLGIPGQVTELQVDRTVAVEAERLDVGYVRDTATGKLHLYCNILHTTKNITFCRFQKTSESIGFNVIDGLSDGRFSYYGEGFSKRHCGMTIETADENEFGTWRCTVGVEERVYNETEQKTPMQALISVTTKSGKGIKRENGKTEDEIQALFVEKDSSLTIMCRADASLAYCWFQHPNGSQFTPVERQTEGEQDFWYSGGSLQTGECGITFAHVSEDDAGMWTCHMSSKYQLGVEITDVVEVRVTGPLAASKKEVGVTVGGESTLYCHTSNGRRPLDYCRFLGPNHLGINVAPSITAENAILNRFYFTPEKKLEYGDCSLTINPVLEEDIGAWTCAALVHDEIIESRDSLNVYLIKTRSIRWQAGLGGAAVGMIVLAAVLAGTIWYKKGRPVPWRRARTSNQTDTPMDLRSNSEQSHPRTSDSTTSSNEQMNP